MGVQWAIFWQSLCYMLFHYPRVLEIGDYNYKCNAGRVYTVRKAFSMKKVFMWTENLLVNLLVYLQNTITNFKDSTWARNLSRDQEQSRIRRKVSSYMITVSIRVLPHKWGDFFRTFLVLYSQLLTRKLFYMYCTIK